MNFELLEKNQILNRLQPEAMARLKQLVILSSVDSTNDYLLKLPHGEQVVACFAEEQTAGKGQRGKRWLSPPGGQIYFSLLWQFTKSPGQILGLSVAVGVAVARALREFGIHEGLQLKWPNDVYYQGQKLVGILVETALGNPGVCNVVVGIGVNLYLTEEAAAAIDQPWTSLHRILQKTIARNEFAGILLNECLKALQEFSENGLSVFQAEWRSLDYLYGKRIQFTSAQQTLTGIMQGISANGELILVDDQQQQHHFLTGTVSNFR